MANLVRNETYTKNVKFFCPKCNKEFTVREKTTTNIKISSSGDFEGISEVYMPNIEHMAYSCVPCESHVLRCDEELYEFLRELYNDRHSSANVAGRGSIGGMIESTVVDPQNGTPVETYTKPTVSYSNTRKANIESIVAVLNTIKESDDAYSAINFEMTVIEAINIDTFKSEPVRFDLIVGISSEDDVITHDKAEYDAMVSTLVAFCNASIEALVEDRALRDQKEDEEIAAEEARRKAEEEARKQAMLDAVNQQTVSAPASESPIDSEEPVEETPAE